MINEPKLNGIKDQLFDEWSAYKKTHINTPSSFAEWKLNNFKGGYYIYKVELDSVLNGLLIPKGIYWVELDKSQNTIRKGGPFESNIDAATDLGRCDYNLYKLLYKKKFPSISPFESNQNLHRAWSNGFEFQMANEEGLTSSIDYPEISGFYWFIVGQIKTICHINKSYDPPAINSLLDLTNEDLRRGKWVGPIEEPKL